MNINKAMAELIGSEEFKAAAKQNARLRVYMGRYKKGTLGNCGTIELLLEFGYTIEVKAPNRKKHK